MLTLKSMHIEDAGKETACRGCHVKIAEKARHVVVLRHGRTRAGRAYDRREALCVRCGAQAMASEMEAYNRMMREFLLSLDEEVSRMEGATP